jgi:hypothetical protein
MLQTPLLSIKIAPIRDKNLIPLPTISNMNRGGSLKILLRIQMKRRRLTGILTLKLVMA